MTNKVVIVSLAFFISSLMIGCEEENSEEGKGISSLSVVANGPATEGGQSSSFTLKLSNMLTSDVKLTFSLTGTAINGVDYERVSSQVIIPAGKSNAEIEIVPIKDFNTEQQENVILKITSADNGQVRLPENAEVIEINDGRSLDEMSIQEIKSLLVNKNSTDETAALFANLLNISEDGIIIGQQDLFSKHYKDAGGDADIKKATGYNPGLQGLDFIFITDDLNNGQSNNWYFQQEALLQQELLKAYREGMFTIFAWHFREPYSGLEFYSKDIVATDRFKAFSSILPGEENHDYYKGKLDKIAEVMSVKGDDGELIPWIFRPFHEFDGNWFWWGAEYCTPAQYIECWRFTVDYLVNTKGLNNVLFAYSPDRSLNTQEKYLERYPGDDYVDILGMDNYGDFKNNTPEGVAAANKKLQIVSDLARQKVKVAGLTETAYFVTPGKTTPIPNFYSENLFNAMTGNGVKLSFMMFWWNKGDTYATPVSGESTYGDFIKFIDKPETLLINELPDLYSLGTK